MAKDDEGLTYYVEACMLIEQTSTKSNVINPRQRKIYILYCIINRKKCVAYPQEDFLFIKLTTSLE
jgi:hypothetical protein